MEQEEMSILTQQGFSEAVSSLSTLLFSVSFSLLRDKEACADAAQNAILHAWQKRGSLRDPKKFKSWNALVRQMFFLKMMSGKLNRLHKSMMVEQPFLWAALMKRNLHKN